MQSAMMWDDVSGSIPHRRHCAVLYVYGSTMLACRRRKLWPVIHRIRIPISLWESCRILRLWPTFGAGNHIFVCRQVGCTSHWCAHSSHWDDFSVDFRNDIGIVLVGKGPWERASLAPSLASRSTQLFLWDVACAFTHRRCVGVNPAVRFSRRLHSSTVRDRMSVLVRARIAAWLSLLMTRAGGLSTKPSFLRRWYSFRASWMAMTSARKTVKLWQMLTLPDVTGGWSVTEMSSNPRKMANPAPVPQLFQILWRCKVRERSLECLCLL